MNKILEQQNKKIITLDEVKKREKAFANAKVLNSKSLAKRKEGATIVNSIEFRQLDKALYTECKTALEIIYSKSKYTTNDKTDKVCKAYYIPAEYVESIRKGANLVFTPNAKTKLANISGNKLREFIGKALPNNISYKSSTIKGTNDITLYESTKTSVSQFFKQLQILVEGTIVVEKSQG